MKLARVQLLIAFFTITTFIVVVHTSCKKDACSGVVCKNGGACSNGVCSCPTGYSGNNCEYSSVIFQNNAYTTISILINYSYAIINPGTSITVYGTPGKAANYTAYTYATNSAGKMVGSMITWAKSDTFPATTASIIQPLDVSPSYFYLQMANSNDSSLVIQQIKLNYQGAADSVVNDTLIDNGHVYAIGYFPYIPGSTSVQVTSFTEFTVGAINWSFPVTTSSVANALVTLTVN